MISTPSRYRQAFSSNHRMWKVKVEVRRNDKDSPLIDISDRVNSCSTTSDFEKRNATASIELDNFDYALSPLNMESTMNQVGGIYNPLLDSNHELVISYGLLTSDGYEYVTKMIGVMGDEIDADTYPGKVQITARDRSKYLQDTYIYQSKPYKMMVLENVIQDMLDEFVPHLNIFLQLDNMTNAMVGKPDSPYIAKDINLWDALQMLASSHNHELRFTEEGRLMLKKVEMDLDEIPPVKIFDESEIVRDSITVSDSDVRNHIVLRIQGLDPIEKKNEDSIEKYGRRYMEVTRAMANIITTAEQAHELVDFILKDLSYVKPMDNMELPLYPTLQVGDVVAINNERLGTSEENNIFRIKSLRDTFNRNSKRTSVILEGFLKVNLEDSIAPRPPTSLRHTMITRTIQNYIGSGWAGSEKTVYMPRVEWSPPQTDVEGNTLSNDFGGYTIYRRHSSESNFFPIASVKSYIAALDLNVDYFYDYTSQPGVNTYKIVSINRMGKKSSESSTININVPEASYK